jgi:seryl-tRNA synthetase
MSFHVLELVDFDTNALRKKVNEVQKQIAAKKKVSHAISCAVSSAITQIILQAKESAEDLVAAKKVIDAEVEAKKKEAKEFEIKMRQKASTIGNIVGPNAPVSLTEVSRSYAEKVASSYRYSRTTMLQCGHGILQERPTSHQRGQIFCPITKFCCN